MVPPVPPPPGQDPPHPVRLEAVQDLNIHPVVGHPGVSQAVSRGQPDLNTAQSRLASQMMAGGLPWGRGQATWR